jgi:transcriptional regulator with XRE-family HTH domain
MLNFIEGARRKEAEIRVRSTEQLDNRIRTLRKERNWTLRKLQEISGITLNALWRLEKGGVPTLKNAFRLANVFDLTVYEIWNIPAPAETMPEQVVRLTDRIKVRGLRTVRGLKMKHLASLAELPMSTVSQIERGCVPSLKSAVQIATVLGASVYELWSSAWE